MNLVYLFFRFNINAAILLIDFMINLVRIKKIKDKI